MLKALLLAAGLGLLALPLIGAFRWDADTRALWTRLESHRVPIRPLTVDFHELEGLPEPVQRYFRATLREGQSLISGVRVRHAGSFNMAESGERWRPFTSTQRVVTHHPGFVWDGRIAMVPGVSVRVHDAFVAGEGILHPALLGLFTLAHMRDSGGPVSQGELMRFLAEASWYPTALLPSQGVQWEAVDERSARATLVAGGLALTLTVRFGSDGLIQSVYAKDRGRTVGREVVPTPWEARFADYEERSALRVPLSGEVAWLLPEGRQPYWRGRITELVYEWAS